MEYLMESTLHRVFHANGTVTVTETLKYKYPNEQARETHHQSMLRFDYERHPKVKENIGTLHAPNYVYISYYTKSETVPRNQIQQ